MATECIQYTIEGIPPEVDRVLRERAAERNQSLNQLVVEELTGVTVGRKATSPQKEKSNFLDLVGKWVPDEAFDEIMASQRQIDPEKWK